MQRSLWLRVLKVVPPTVSVLSALLAVTFGAIPSASSVTPRIYPGNGVVAFGDAVYEGAPTGTALAAPIVAMAPTADGKGYWLAGADGGVFSYGDAPFYGSTGAIHLSAPVVAMAPAPNDSGYWLAAMDGGVFSFGSAQFYGSMGATKLNQPVVGMAATPDGKGYWLVAADGGIFTFGDAQFYGSLGGVSLNAAVVGMAPTPDGKGYSLVAADGGVFTFGDAQFYGSLGSQDIPASIAGMAATPDGDGYWLVGTDGSVYSFGDATSYGSTASNKPLSPVAAIAATPDGKGYWLLEPDDFSYSFADPPPYDLGPSSSIVETASSQVQGDPDAGQGAFCNPYGPCEAWCALFATWVWRQVGIPIPSYAFVGDIYDWAADNTVVLSPGQLPAPGDAILYGTGPQTVGTAVHTGIVVMVWPDGAVVTVEGDAGPAPTGQLAVVVNGPFLPVDSMPYNGFGVFGFAQPTN